MDKANMLKKKVIEIRTKVIKMIYEAKSGHIGGSLSSVDILTVLFYEIMNIKSEKNTFEEDKFVLSKGHSVESYYAILSSLGYIDEEELKTYCKYKSRLIGHPTNKVSGIDINTGSLGHGLSVSVGMALANKMDNKRGKIYVLMGDGELGEGSVWEAAMAARHYRLDNLVAIIDRNKLQISGNTESVMSLEPLKLKWESFGWAVKEVDGHDIPKLIQTFREIPFEIGKPNLIIAHTIKGKGISFIENNHKWHHGVPNQEEYDKAMTELSQQLKEVTDVAARNDCM